MSSTIWYQIECILLGLMLHPALGLPKSPSDDFVCPGTGQFANSGDCGSYHQCFGEGDPPVNSPKCGRGLIFDSNEKMCLPEAKANCINCKKDGFFPDKTSAFYYFECSGGFAERIHCAPSGTVFNFNDQTCDEGKEEELPRLEPFSGGNPHGYEVHPQISKFLNEDIRRKMGFPNRTRVLSVVSSAQAGSVLALGSSSTGKGPGEDGGFAHSQASIKGNLGNGKKGDGIFKGLEASGSEFSSVHAMATATGTGKVKEQGVEISPEGTAGTVATEEYFDVGPDSIKLTST